MEFHRAKASKTVVDNDKTWIALSSTQKQHIDDLERYARYGFWTGLRKEKDGFYKVLEQALPEF